MNIKKIFVFVVGVLTIMITACEKLPLQKSKEYKTSFYQNNLNMTVREFIDSRPDLFSGLSDALAYLENDPAYKDVIDLYNTSQGNTFFLMSDDALINLGVTGAFGSYWTVNRVIDTDPSSPTYNLTVNGSSWSQYPKDRIADLLRYHVLKGDYRFANLKSTPRWYDSYAISPTNDSAKVNLYLQADRDGFLRINYFPPTTVPAVPRTPNLIPKKEVIHVLNAYIRIPTRQTNNSSV